jgi:hypothetical protein
VDAPVGVPAVSRFSKCKVRTLTPRQGVGAQTEGSSFLLCLVIHLNALRLLKPVCAKSRSCDSVAIPVLPNHGMILVIIIAGAWLLMAVAMVCALAAAAQRPAGRSEREALASMKTNSTN